MRRHDGTYQPAIETSPYREGGGAREGERSERRADARQSNRP